MEIALLQESPVNTTVRTVSDTKRAFYNTHTRPINSIYRRVVEEMMVEMHLLSVNADFRYDDIYGLGVFTSFDRFMQGYRPDSDKASVFAALCHAVGDDPQQYRQSAEDLKAESTGLSLDDMMARLTDPNAFPSSKLAIAFRQIAEHPNFKYSRLFAIGLYSLLEGVDAELVKHAEKLQAVLEQLATPLKISSDKLQKDLELYRSNLDKMIQAQIVMEDILKADRKKREDREKAKEAANTPPSASPESA